MSGRVPSQVRSARPGPFPSGSPVAPGIPVATAVPRGLGKHLATSAAMRDAGMVWRVRSRETFLALRRSRRRVRRGPVTVTFAPGEPLGPPQVAYAIGRKAGGAVVRNRLRRRLRAIVAELAPALRPGAYLLGANAEATEMTFEELRAVVAEAVQAIHREQR